MGQHAKRFNAVNAPKGGGLRDIADRLKEIADAAEEHFDPNSAEVVGAMQRFEQGLALLSTAPARPDGGEPAKGKRTGGRKTGDDTPKNTAEGQGATDA